MSRRVWLAALVLARPAKTGTRSPPPATWPMPRWWADSSSTLAEGVEGDFFNCDFEIEVGPVHTVTVFDYGEANDWSSVRRGFVDNRGGVTDVGDLGDEAFYPNDTGARELVVRADDRIVSGTVFSGLEEPTVEVIGRIAGLSDAIPERLAS